MIHIDVYENNFLLKNLTTCSVVTKLGPTSYQ